MMIEAALELLRNYGATGLLLVAVIVLWRRLETISERLTTNYQRALDANTNALLLHAKAIDAETGRIKEHTDMINSLMRQISVLEGAISGRFAPCAPAPRGQDD